MKKRHEEEIKQAIIDDQTDYSDDSDDSDDDQIDDELTLEQYKNALIEEYNKRKAVLAELVPIKNSDKNMYVYLLTSGDLKQEKYKIGIHTGSKEKLKSRYHTYFEDITIIRFVLIKNSTHEKNLHQIFNEYKTHGEWFQLDYKTIITKFDEYINNNISPLDNYVPEIPLNETENNLLQILIQAIKHIGISTNATYGLLHKALNTYQ